MAVHFCLLNRADNLEPCYNYHGSVCTFDSSHDSWDFECFVSHGDLNRLVLVIKIQCIVHVMDVWRLFIDVPPSTMHADLGVLLALAEGMDVNEKYRVHIELIKLASH
ncbi:hypothetical protein E2562_037624 [Oryza meyeriana var. granulata]|uniref:Uncharacterized protein n=1 Tax=Oryza meyeriana var. granulata TaxID=110450 RepID=A0A6G1CBX0_9ORYZ|nr:hypothetical protein E2562_037624 [Oryza meyeriana var. granulata]